MDVDTSQHGTSRALFGLFFLPVSELIKLLYGATALEAAFERSPKKSRHWPSWKSLNKWVFARTPSFPPPAPQASNHLMLWPKTSVLAYASRLAAISENPAESGKDFWSREHLRIRSPSAIGRTGLQKTCSLDVRRHPPAHLFLSAFRQWCFPAWRWSRVVLRTI